MSRVPDDATASRSRSTGFTFTINGNSLTADGFEDQRQWACDYWSALAPFHIGVHVDFLMEKGEARVRQAYGDRTYERLTTLTRTCDPTNLFRLNRDISPAWVAVEGGGRVNRAEREPGGGLESVTAECG